MIEITESIVQSLLKTNRPQYKMATAFTSAFVAKVNIGKCPDYRGCLSLSTIIPVKCIWPLPEGSHFCQMDIKEQFCFSGRIFNLHVGCLSLHRGPPVSIPVRRTVLCVTSTLPVMLIEPVWAQKTSHCAPENFPPWAGMGQGTSSIRSWCTNHCSTIILRLQHFIGRAQSSPLVPSISPEEYQFMAWTVSSFDGFSWAQSCSSTAVKFSYHLAFVPY